MKFEPKISGTRVTDFKIKTPLKEQIHSLSEIITKIQNQKTMDFILDTYRFTKGRGGEWYAVFDYDALYKIGILENHPEYEQEMIDYFGENWTEHYIRFNH